MFVIVLCHPKRVSGVATHGKLLDIFGLLVMYRSQLWLILQKYHANLEHFITSFGLNLGGYVEHATC